MVSVLGKQFPIARHDSPVTAEVMAHLPHPTGAERERLLEKIKRLTEVTMIR